MNNICLICFKIFGIFNICYSFLVVWFVIVEIMKGFVFFVGREEFVGKLVYIYFFIKLCKFLLGYLFYVVNCIQENYVKILFDFK